MRTWVSIQGVGSVVSLIQTGSLCWEPGASYRANLI